jgi:hypothetical protein
MRWWFKIPTLIPTLCCPLFSHSRPLAPNKEAARGWATCAAGLRRGKCAAASPPPAPVDSQPRRLRARSNVRSAMGILCAPPRAALCTRACRPISQQHQTRAAAVAGVHDGMRCGGREGPCASERLGGDEGLNGGPRRDGRLCGGAQMTLCLQGFGKQLPSILYRPLTGSGRSACPGVVRLWPSLRSPVQGEIFCPAVAARPVSSSAGRRRIDLARPERGHGRTRAGGPWPQRGRTELRGSWRLARCRPSWRPRGRSHAAGLAWFGQLWGVCVRGCARACTIISI